MHGMRKADQILSWEGYFISRPSRMKAW